MIMVDKVWCMWYTVGEYKKSSKQKIILYRNNHTTRQQPPQPHYIYSITQLQKTPEKILTTASMTRIYFIMMLVVVVRYGHNK